MSNPNLGKNRVPEIEDIVTPPAPADVNRVRALIRDRFTGADRDELEQMLGVTA